MKKLKLKPLTKRYAKDYFKIACDTSIHEFVPFMECSCEDEAETFISMNKHYNNNDKILGIFSGKLLVGAMLLSLFEDDLTIHIFIGKEYRNYGFATQATIELINIIKEKKISTIKKLIFEVKKNNNASLSLQKKLSSYLLNTSKNYYVYAYNII